jgi:hypothetical protein
MEDISGFIATMRQQGYTDDQIRQTLMQGGWSEEDIAEYLPAGSDSGEPPVSSAPVETAPAPSVTLPVPQDVPTGEPAAPVPVVDPSEVPQPLSPLEETTHPVEAHSGPPVKLLAAMVIGGLAIFLVVIGGAFALIRRPAAPVQPTDRQAEAKITPPPSETVPAATASALVVYTQTDTATGSAYMAYAYDLNSGKRQDLTEPVLNGTSGIIRLCRFSPDGTRLPVFGVDSRFRSATVSAFITASGEVQPVKDLTGSKDLPLVAASFGSQCRWLDGETLMVASERQGAPDSRVNRRILYKGGVLQEATASGEIARYRFGDVTYTESRIQTAVTLPDAISAGGNTIALDSDEHPIGRIGQSLVTLRRVVRETYDPKLIEDLEARAATDSAAAASLAAMLQTELDSLSDAMSDASARARIRDQVENRTVYSFTQYDTQSGLARVKETVYPQTENFEVVAASVHPDGTRIIVREDDITGDRNYWQGAYFLFDPATGKKSPLGDISVTLAPANITAEVPFKVTEDGVWLVSPEYTRSADSKFLDVSIVAINMETKKKVTICERYCRAYQVNTPGRPVEE